MTFNNFSCLIFQPKMSQYSQAQKHSRGQNVLILPICILSKPPAKNLILTYTRPTVNKIGLGSLGTKLLEDARSQVLKAH